MTNTATLVAVAVVAVFAAGCGSVTKTVATTSAGTTSTQAGSAAPALTGLGATKAAFTAAHGLSLSGCSAGTCFGPHVATGAGDDYQFETVFVGGGKVDGYTEWFAKGTSGLSSPA